MTATSTFMLNGDNDRMSVKSINSTMTKSRVCNPDECALQDHDYTFIPTLSLLSECSEKIVVYIAGFVVFKLKSTLHCETCINALFGSNSDELFSLIALKSKGGLILPSKDVIKVCILCERYFRQNVSTSSSPLSHITILEITQSVLSTFISKTCFQSLSEHMLECDPTSNHLVLLLKAIIEEYLKVRYFYAGKQYTAKSAKSIEKLVGKTIQN